MHPAELAHHAHIPSSATEEVLAAVRFGIPELTASHVVRPRLVEALSAAASVPLVLVSGPAGTGKTSLVAEWVRTGTGRSEKLGWVTFEDGDSAFWDYLLECLRHLGLELAEDVFGSARGDGVLGIERLAVLAALIAREPRRITLVLDGYEMVSTDLAHEVDFLVRHTLGHLCLVFVGRVDPVLALYRYRLSDSLLEIRAADLAFTDEEAAELLASLGVRLGIESVHDLNQRVKGWAVGLHFSGKALSGRDHPERSVATVVTQTCDINEYLSGEVLASQPPEVRRFLLDTSVPKVLTADLVEELVGPRAVRILEELAQSETFIEPVPEQAGYYRYFPFFRELLRARLAYEDTDRMVELHRGTASWLERHGYPERALAHLAVIEAWDDVALHIVRGLLIGRLLAERPDAALVKVAGHLPEDLGSVSGGLVRAAVHLREGNDAACAEQLALVRDRVGADGEAATLALAVLHAVNAARAEPAETAVTTVEQAEGELEGDLLRVHAAEEPVLSALVRLSKGVALLRQGHLAPARRAITTAVGIDAARRFPAFRAECLGRLALIDLLEGDLSEASRKASEAVSASDDAGIPASDRAPAAVVALSRVALERYELRAARDHVASAALCRGLAGDHVSRTLLEVAHAGLERASGHLQQGLTRLDAAAARDAATDPWLADHVRLEAAKLSLASGRPEQALSQLAQLRSPEDPQSSVVAAAVYAEQGRMSQAEQSLTRARKGQPSTGTEVAALLVDVLQASRRRAPGRAHVALERSLRLAAPESLRRPFREAGPSVQRLLAAETEVLRSHPWLSHATPEQPATRRDGGAQAQATSHPEVVEALTPKELEVLHHLEELLTTEEIAEKMFVSVNTVRTHVRSILRKLGVSRRNAAVRKARKLGIFAG